MAEAPVGFQPRSSIRPLWLHTLEFEGDGRLAGVVIVIVEDKVEAVARLVDATLADLVVHQLGREVFLRLTRSQATVLRATMGKMNEATSPFGENSYDAYNALVGIENVLDWEE